jgi:hypothetical protein
MFPHGSGSRGPAFDRLAWLRRRIRSWSQATLDREAGWPNGTTAQIERGHRPPPSRNECGRLDGLLGLEPGTTWAAALPVWVARRLPSDAAQDVLEALAQSRPQ